MNKEKLDSEILKSVIDNASDAVIVANQKAEIIFLNLTVEEIFGYNKEELIGEKIEILIPERFHNIHANHFKNFLLGEENKKLMSSRNELVGKRKDGTEFNVEITISRLNYKDNIYLTAIVRDVSEKKQYQDKIQKQNINLKELNTKLTNLNKLKNQFIGIAAHDLRNPLMRIKLCAEMLSEDDNDQKTEKEFKTIIYSSAEYMTNLIDDLLSVNQIETGHLKLNKEKTDIKEFFSETRNTFLPIANKKKVDLKVTYNGEVGSFIIDQFRMKQVCENILSNAIKFSNAGSKIEIMISDVEDIVEIKFIDEGIGIDKEKLEELFKPFSKISSTGTEGEKGTGLGLVIVKNIIELHNGTIEVSSEKGNGTTFTIKIPQQS